MTRYFVVGRHGLLLTLILTLLCFGTPAAAQVGGIPALSINEGVNGSTYSLSLQILALMTAGVHQLTQKRGGTDAGCRVVCFDKL